MAFESALAEFVDPAKRLSATRLADFSNLDPAQSSELAEAWPEVGAERRLTLITDLAELAEDNVDLNFDEVFKTALSDSEPSVRAAALRGLNEYEGRDLIGPFVDMLNDDPDPGVRREAAIALGRYALAGELGYLGDADTQTIKEALIESAENMDEDERVRARAIEALGALSGEDTENLIESIYQEDSIWLKVGAVDAMGRSCNEAWLPVVIREMENRSPEMRHAAAFAAGEIGDEEAVQPLLRLAIEDPDRQVQLAAIHSLGEIGGQKARVALTSVLYEGDDELREAVEEAISEIAFNDDPLSPPNL